MKKSVKRYAVVGTGARGEMYIRAAANGFPATAALAALCDRNPGRLQMMRAELERQGIRVPIYGERNFARMLRETRPDIVIVATVDCTHDRYICAAMEYGCDVITEKPMTTDQRKCRRIIETQRRTGRHCQVTFNYRYSPVRTQVKDLLMSGVIGEVLSVDFHWLLDTCHGADYFRRWHRNKANSGGLLVHKATHHFDLVNWWLSSVPVSVFARGERCFYRPETARRYGLAHRGERCSGCRESRRCPFSLDLRQHPALRAMYLENERHDGYFRDRCVFDDAIDIDDAMHVMVSYANNATMSYSLHAFMPYEGYTVAFNGSKGRLEHHCQESVYVSGDGSAQGRLLDEKTFIRVCPHFRVPYLVELWAGKGDHGGGDLLLLRDIMAPPRQRDKYLRAADQRAGAFSILTGIAANISMRRQRPVRIDAMVPDLSLPDYPPMPGPERPLPLPAGAADQRARRR